MTDYQKIVQLRNSGKTQAEIADQLGISRRSVIRYLKQGKIPKYSRPNKSNRPDPMENFYQIASDKIESNPKILLTDLYDYLCGLGYTGSERTLRRKTRDQRRQLKAKEVYFQREVKPGEIMEGDFTELYLEIGGKRRKVYLWVTSLPYSNSYYATAYYNCTFECFADGSVNAFNEFGGIAQKYRLDNMSPAVSKILSGKDRVVTQRYKDFQDHYGFMQDFCNPAKGNEKGNVESNIGHFKKRLLSQIALHQLTFTYIDALREYVWSFCKERNNTAQIKPRFEQEGLQSLPSQRFKPFRTTVVKISRYSLFNLDRTGHQYSVPSQYIGLSLEARVYYDRIEVVQADQVVAQHKRLHGRCGHVSIQLEHVIDGLIRKPGAMKDWKHRDVLFDRPAWRRFYELQKSQGRSDKEFLSCLRLIKQHGRSLVTLAMELAAEGQADLSSTALENLITNRLDNIYDIKPIKTDLTVYDDLMGGKLHGSESKSQS